MGVSTIPAVWSALHSLLGTATGLTTHYGPPMTESGDFLAVGYAGDDDAISTDNEWAQLGAKRQTERYTVACLLWLASGDSDMVSRVQAAYAALSACSDALAADYTLGGLCTTFPVHIGSHRLTPEQDASGSSVRLAFTVNVAARIGALS